MLRWRWRVTGAYAYSIPRVQSRYVFFRVSARFVRITALHVAVADATWSMRAPYKIADIRCEMYLVKE